MFKYVLNTHKIVRDNLYEWLQKPKRLDWLKAWTKPFRVIHADFVAVVSRYRYLGRFNGQLMYMERILNDTFAPDNRAIYITDGNFIDPTYLFPRTKNKPIWLYPRWKAGQSYAAGEYAIDGKSVYLAITASTGDKPSETPAKWVKHRAVSYLRRREDFSQSGVFVVNVPDGLEFDEVRMRALIDSYRIAGTEYTINIYTI